MTYIESPYKLTPEVYRKSSQNIFSLIRRREISGKLIRSQDISTKIKLASSYKLKWESTISEHCSHSLTNYGYVILYHREHRVLFKNLQNQVIQQRSVTRGAELVQLPIDCPFTVLIIKKIPLRADVYDSATGCFLRSISGILPCSHKKNSAFYIHGSLCFLKLIEGELAVHYFKKKPNNSLELIHRTSIPNSRKRKITKALVSKTHAVFFSEPIPSRKSSIKPSESPKMCMHTLNLLNGKMCVQNDPFDKNYESLFFSDSILCLHSREEKELTFLDLQKEPPFQSLLSLSFMNAEVLSFYGSIALLTYEKKYCLLSPFTDEKYFFSLDGNDLAFQIDSSQLLIYQEQKNKFIIQEVSSQKPSPIQYIENSAPHFLNPFLQFSFIKMNSFVLTDSKHVAFFEPIKFPL